MNFVLAAAEAVRACCRPRRGAAVASASQWLASAGAAAAATAPTPDGPDDWSLVGIGGGRAEDPVELVAGTTAMEEPTPADLAIRVAAARQYGQKMRAELAAGRCAPKALALPQGLRRRTWVATECEPDAVGLYAKWAAADAAGRSRPSGIVRGFASVAEAEGYIAGLGSAVPDLRR